jgi:hypothetical protein
VSEKGFQPLKISAWYDTAMEVALERVVADSRRNSKKTGFRTASFTGRPE